MNSFSLRTRSYSGQGSLDIFECFTNKHVWVICDASLACSPLIEKLRNALPADSRISIPSDITPDPTIGTVVQGVTQMQSLRPDVVVGFGDGSTLDTAEAIVWFSRQFGIDIGTYIAIPTTSDTGSEVISTCVISDPDEDTKYLSFNNALYPDMVVLDPTLVVSVPPATIVNTGVDVLTHALGVYVFAKTGDFTDAPAEKAAQIVFQYLSTTVSKGDRLTTRGKMYNASTLAGMTFNQAGLGINHAIAYQLGGQSHLPHGLANALLLTHVVHSSARDPRAAKRYARSAKACHLCPDNASDIAALSTFIHHVELLKKQCASSSSADALKDEKRIWSQCISSMVQAALTDVALQTNPRVVDVSAMQELPEELL